MNFSHSIFTAFRRLIYKQNASELLWVMFGQIASAVGSLVAVRLLTTYLTPEAYGEFSLGNTIAVLATQTLFGPLMNAYVRHWSIYKERQQAQAFLKAAFKLVVWLSLAFLIISSLVWLILLNKAPQWLSIAICGSLLALVSGYISILNGLQLAERQRKIVAWHQGLIQWIQPISAILFILLLTSSSSIALLGYLIGCSITLFSQLLLFQPILKASKKDSNLSVSSKGILYQVISYAYPFAFWGILTWMQLVSDRWALQVFYGEGTVGFYTVLYQLGYQPITLIGTICVQFIYPILFEQAGDASDLSRVKNALRLWKRIIISMIGISSLSLIFSIVFHRVILQTFSTTEYERFSHLLPLMVTSSTLFNMGQIMSLIPMLFSDSKSLLYPKVLTGLIATLLNFILISQYGLVGAITANIISALFYLTLISAICRQQIKTKFNQNSLA